MVAPLSTILFVPRSHEAPTSSIPSQSNIDKDKHWTDYPAPGSIALLQQPDGQICAVCGDILATRLEVRGVKGVIADGRVRDIKAMNELCNKGDFTVWSRALSTVGTSLEAKAWAANVPLKIGNVTINADDIMCADESEGACAVIPRERLNEVYEMLPALKQIDDDCVADVQAGVDVTTVFRRHRGGQGNCAYVGATIEDTSHEVSIPESSLNLQLMRGFYGSKSDNRFVWELCIIFRLKL